MFKVSKWVCGLGGIIGAMYWLGCESRMTLFQGAPNNERVLQVVYPFSVLQKDQRIIRPENTDTVYEYYLLENLGAGLLRDDILEVGGYRGVLALSWVQSDPFTWHFTLRKGLRWSDGSEMTPHQIGQHLLKLKRRGSRHTVVMRNLKDVAYLPSRHQLKLSFFQPTNRSLLHELSLADTVILHPSNPDQGWRVTSGPFYVSRYDPKGKILELEANRYSPLHSEASPRRVRLFALKDLREAAKLFSEIDADIYYLPFLYVTSEFREVRQKAPRSVKGEPATMFFLVFNPKHALFPSERARGELAHLVNQTFEGLNVEGSVRAENQLVPPGYGGRLDKFHGRKIKVEKLKGKRIVINLHPAFREFADYLRKLERLGKSHGTRIEFKFTVYTPDDQRGDDEFARLEVFRGNQKDPVGNWSFLVSEPQGPLHPFREVLYPMLLEATRAKNELEQMKHLRRLHRKVLESSLAVPFAVQVPTILTSGRINLDHFNRYDMRLRFYDVQWM